MKQLRLTISNIIERTNDIVTYELSSSEPVAFVPGQFISLEYVLNGHIVRRSYSLHNSPFVNEPLSISVKRIDNGLVSRLLQDHAKIGDTLTAYEPTGLFTYEYQQKIQRDIMLIGAGTGITPLFSILKSALQKEPQSRITLIYSNRSVDSTLFYDELKTLEQQYPQQLQCVFLFSNNKDLSFARLNRELLEKLITQYLRFAKANAIIYTCGPADYMLMCRIVLLGFGFEAGQLKKETFVLPEEEVDEDNTTEIKIDTNTYTVDLQFEGKTNHLAVAYPKSILDRALEQNINLPYSCKSGVCGTCAATCTAGKINMRYNEVLTDKEVATGRILLCTAYPISDNVKIEV